MHIYIFSSQCLYWKNIKECLLCRGADFFLKNTSWTNWISKLCSQSMAKTWYGAKIECAKSLWMTLLLLFSCWVLSESLCPHGLQHSRLLCPLLTPGACSNSCPLSRRCHPAISSSVVPFSSCLRSFPASGSSLKNQLFASGGQSIGASASVLPINIQDWFPLGLTSLISLQSKRHSRVFSNKTV